MSDGIIQGGWSGRGTLVELVNELDRQRKTKVDFVADSRSVCVDSDGGKLFLHESPLKESGFLPDRGMELKETALEQLGGRLDPEIPVRFIKELASKRPTRAENLINGLMFDGPRRLFFRTLDGKVRAVLSDRYRVLDNYDLAFSALDSIRQAGGEVIECSLSEKNMRIKFTTRAIWEAIEVRKQGGTGHGWLYSEQYAKRVGRQNWADETKLPGGPGTVFPLGQISNSETGHGGLRIQLGLLQGICINGAIIEEAISQIHLGEKLDIGRFSEETVAAESQALYLKARDVIKSTFNPDAFRKLVDIARGAQSQKIEEPISAVANIAKAASLSEKAKEAILSYFISDYDLTRYGLAQSVSRYSQDLESADDGADVEALAGKILRDEVAVG